MLASIAAAQSTDATRLESRIERFAWIDAQGERSIAGERAAVPAGSATGGVPGYAIAVYQSKDASITLPGDRFTAYLREEGLDGIAALRASAGTSSKPATEHDSRCAKALIRIGIGLQSHGGFDRRAGLTLELIPTIDPGRLRRGGPLRLQLLLRGKPLAGALLNAFRKDGARSPITVRTDVRGEARIPRMRPGIWLISTVHMMEAPAGSGADWSSAWSSLTLQIRQ